MSGIVQVSLNLTSVTCCNEVYWITPSMGVQNRMKWVHRDTAWVKHGVTYLHRCITHPPNHECHVGFKNQDNFNKMEKLCKEDYVWALMMTILQVYFTQYNLGRLSHGSYFTTWFAWILHFWSSSHRRPVRQIQADAMTCCWPIHSHSVTSMRHRIQVVSA